MSSMNRQTVPSDRNRRTESWSTNTNGRPFRIRGAPSQFVEYQQELSRRVSDGKASRYAVRLVDAFEETWGGRTYFAAFELVPKARDLEQMLQEEREVHRRTKVPPTRDPVVWARHVTWAKVFMAGIAALHESKAVHADLKPANALLIKDPSLSAGYELKLIDMRSTDFTSRRS